LRYMPEPAKARVSALKEGERLYPMWDGCNPADYSAVALRTATADRMMIGYVPRYLAQDALTLFQRCDPEFINIFVHRVNRDAPLQQRLLCRMHACWPEGFEPCSVEAFQPIPKGVPQRCGV